MIKIIVIAEWVVDTGVYLASEKEREVGRYRYVGTV